LEEAVKGMRLIKQTKQRMKIGQVVSRSCAGGKVGDRVGQFVVSALFRGLTLEVFEWSGAVA